MKILVKDGVKYLPYQYKDENELEELFRKQIEIIFGNKCLFFEKFKVKSKADIVSIPDGFIIVFDDEKWFIIEVELAMHPLYEHIVPQISKFNSAIKNLATRKKLIDIFYDEIESNIKLRYKFQTMGIKKELYKLISDIVNKNPEIIITIDRKTDELNEVCDNLPFSTKILEFKTYIREGMDLAVSIYIFDTVKAHKGESNTEKKVLIKPYRGYKTIAQILEVSELVLHGRKSFNEALEMVAKRKNINSSTVRDKCTRGLGINTAQFIKLLRDKKKLINFLIGKFPESTFHINALLNK